eukprot:16610-Chlamydomonas_euryale.AAC.15
MLSSPSGSSLQTTRGICAAGRPVVASVTHTKCERRAGNEFRRVACPAKCERPRAAFTCMRVKHGLDRAGASVALQTGVEGAPTLSCWTQPNMHSQNAHVSLCHPVWPVSPWQLFFRPVQAPCRYSPPSLPPPPAKPTCSPFLRQMHASCMLALPCPRAVTPHTPLGHGPFG